MKDLLLVFKLDWRDFYLNGGRRKKNLHKGPPTGDCRVVGALGSFARRSLMVPTGGPSMFPCSGKSVLMGPALQDDASDTPVAGRGRAGDKAKSTCADQPQQHKETPGGPAAANQTGCGSPWARRTGGVGFVVKCTTGAGSDGLA